MLQTRVRAGHNSVDSSLQHDAGSRNTVQVMLLKPAVVLAFLVAMTGSVWVIASRSNAGKNQELPNTIQSVSESSLEAADQKSPINSEPSTSTQEGNSNSVKVESVTNNGVTETTLEINGEEVPIEPNTTSQISLPNGSQSVTNVTTRTQTGNGGYNYNSNTSSSFSHSFNSQNTVGGP